jgi:hypothetical protein
MLPRELNIEEIQEILESGDFGRFIGARENLFLEAKLALPFDMSEGHSTNAKLAKYSASFANQKGGFLICGLRTKQMQNTPHDVVIGLDLVEESDFYKVVELTSRIFQSTYPQIRAIVKWYSSREDPKVGVGTVYVPEQDEAKKYFHIKIRTLEGEKIKNELFGVPIRGDGFTDWVKVEEMYRRSKLIPSDLQGVHESLSQQISELSRALSARSSAANRAKTDALHNKIKELEND